MQRRNSTARVLPRTIQYAIINELYLLTLYNPTIYNDILHLRKQGINVPNSKEKLGLSEEKIQFRLNFIESKLQAGWNKSEIAKALGMDYSSLHHFVKRHS